MGVIGVNGATFPSLKSTFSLFFPIFSNHGCYSRGLWRAHKEVMGVLGTPLYLKIASIFSDLAWPVSSNWASLTSPSLPDVTIFRLDEFGKNFDWKIFALWPDGVFDTGVFDWSSGFHTQIFVSSEPEANKTPSWDHPNELTHPWCPDNWCIPEWWKL